MTNSEAITELIEKWHSTKSWAESLIYEQLNIESAFDILQSEHRGKKMLGDTGWYYRTHGIGVEVTKPGNKGGIDFDFNQELPNRYTLRGYMIKQLNEGSLTKRHYRDLLQDERLWNATYEISVN